MADAVSAGKEPREHAPARIGRLAASNYEVVTLAPPHLPGVVRVYGESFPGTLLVALGPGVLTTLFDAYTSLPGGCGAVCLDGGEVVGFAVASEDSARFRRALLRRRWATLAYRVLRRLATSPRVAGRLASYLQFVLSSAKPPDGRVADAAGTIPPASLTLVAVAPAHRRRGVADRLVRAFLREMAERGVDRVKLATAARNEAALALYARQGWRLAGSCYNSTGQLVHRLEIDVASLRGTDGEVSRHGEST